MLAGLTHTTLLLLLTHFVCTFYAWKGGGGVGTPWATAEQEAQDEVRDAEILRSVQESMAAWRQRRSSHRTKRAESSICYNGIGCFQSSGPYGYIDILPSPPEEIATRFLLYSSRRSRGDTPLMDVPFTNLSAVFDWAGQAYNVSAPTKIIVHGFGSSCSYVWAYEMRSALMSVEDCNVICVDWEGGATLPNYVRAAANARLVGKQLAMLIQGLQKLGLSLQNIHMIGFSLGAHVAGFAGAELKNLSRITGLDPAGPLFESQDPRARLDSSDAHFVDVIHSNGENLILGGLGSSQPMGHVDFYPNGGRMQKGCSHLFVGAVTDIFLSVSEVEGRSLCNHRRAYKFFTDSVSPQCQFPAVRCDSFDKYAAGACFPCSDGELCSNMGYYADKVKGRGVQYLVTRDEEPFCAHQYLVRVDSTPSVLPVVSYGKIQLTLISNDDLNETFVLTMKDDEELKVGASLSKIIVPHPALQSFTALEILYTAYSGWISSGLAKWSIDKISLMDTFGKSLSICKKGLLLETGVPVVLPLFPGVCNPPFNNTNITNYGGPVSLPTNATNQKYIPTQVVKIGDEILKNNTNKADIEVETHYLTAQWQPVLEYPASSGSSGNSLDQESSRGFKSSMRTEKAKREHNGTSTQISKNDTLVLGELVMATTVNTTVNNSTDTITDSDIKLKMSLMGEFVKKEEKKNGPPYEFVKPDSTESKKIELTTKGEIKEPVLAATTPRQHRRSSKQEKWHPEVELNPPSMGATESWHLWDAPGSSREIKNMDLDKNTTSTLSALTIQFLPQRLISFLEQAEKYARLAFSPFLSSDPESRNQRRMRFLPQFWWSKSDERKEKKLEVEDKETSTKGASEPVVAIAYHENKSDFKPKYIPLTSTETDKKIEKAETDFNRPSMIKEHLEEPIVEDSKEKEKEKDR
ncbi:LOW QUALITY PROTEIN: uncharacterized protein LOC124368929 [Homalodisca vitripennis]|nr:LOW QUALITY PROTEIN: uncharacterized protein LOC124368929 [Homalodisca vitripennis]